MVSLDWLNRYFAVGDAIVINNIFGTLFLGTVYMQACEYIKDRKVAKGVIWFLVPTLLSVLTIGLLSSGLLDSKLGMIFFKHLIYLYQHYC